ncbi:MAG: cupin domain-containing protein [Planctomycetaceae bacterium]
MTDSSNVALPSALTWPKKSILGIGYALLIDAAQTGGAYEVMQFVVPGGHGPPPHVHRREDESFYIVDGEFDVTIGERTLRARTGDCVHLPRGQAHSFRNATERMGTFLCWVVPGNLAGFFDAFAREWPEDDELPPPVTQDDIAKMLSAAARHDIEIVTGPPA